MADGMGIIFDLFKQPQTFDFFDNPFSGLFDIKPLIDTGIFFHNGIFIYHFNKFKIVPDSHLIVIGVMGRGHLHCSRAKFLVHILIGYDWNFPVDNG